MAKSYVTQFAENVNKSRKDMIGAFKSKGFPANYTDTLDMLVGRVYNIGESVTYPTYEREPSLPDIDAIFDNDPLRLINGGEYQYSAIILMRIAYDNTAKFTYATNSVVSKIVWSDGTEDKVATKVIGDDGIYTSKNGDKFCYCKVYYNQDVAATYTNKIDSFLPEYSYEVVWDASHAITFTRYLRYFRAVGSWVTTDAPLIWYSTYFTGGGNYCPSCIRIDGYNQGGAIQVQSLESLIVNGLSTGSVPVYVSVPSSNNKVAKINKLVLNGSIKSELGVASIGSPFELYVNDNVSSLGTSVSSETYWCALIKKLHLGNGLTKFLNANVCYALEDLTLSEGAFGINESAYTLDFSYSQNLSRQSVLNLFNNLADRTGMTANVLKLHTFTKTLVTDEEKTILTSKNWTLS